MSINIDEPAADLEPAAFSAVSAPVEVDHVTDLGAWNDLVARAPFPHLPQTFAYGAGKAATGWAVRRAVFRRDGRAVAFATVLEKRLAGLRVLSRVNRGPVFLDPSPTPELQRLVYAALRRHWPGPLLIAPALQAGDDANAILRAAGFVQRQRHGWLSGRIDLCPDESAIWASFASTFRNRVRAAEKAGAQLRIADDDATFEWMLDRHAANMSDKAFRAVGAGFLRPMREAGRNDITMFQLLQGDRPVAGMSVVRFGRQAEYHIGWFGPEGRKLNAGNFLMWNIVKELKRRGVASFDVGGMKPGDGYTRFKRTMIPVEYELAGEWVSL
jgi:hypothetical protein